VYLGYAFVAVPVTIWNAVQLGLYQKKTTFTPNMTNWRHQCYCYTTNASIIIKQPMKHTCSDIWWETRPWCSTCDSRGHTYHRAAAGLHCRHGNTTDTATHTHTHTHTSPSIHIYADLQFTSWNIAVHKWRTMFVSWLQFHVQAQEGAINLQLLQLTPHDPRKSANLL